MGNFWNPLTCFTVCVFVYAFGEFLSLKTKGIVSALMFVCILFLIGFWTGILPKDITNKPGLVVAMSNFGIALLITNLGTIINLEDLCREWKTVLIGIAGVLGVVFMSFTVGTMLFGREYAIISGPAVAGSTVAGIILTASAEAAHRGELGAFVILVLSFHKFIGIPVTTLCIRKDLKAKKEHGYFGENANNRKEFKLPNVKFVPDLPEKMRTTTVYLAKLSIVAMIANYVGLLTLIPGSSPANYWLNPNISCLLFGLLFTRIGFLEKGTLEKSASNGVIMFGCMLVLPGSLAKVTVAGLLKMILPVFGMLILGAIGIIIFCVIAGKLLGYSPEIAIAIGMTSMLAYPATQIMSDEGIASMEGTEAEKLKARDYLLPKMIIGGFVTVTIVSVMYASIVGPVIFK